MLLSALACLSVAHAVVFTDVTVIPMDRERTLDRQTVLVVDGKIADIGPVDKVKYSSTAQKIDGKGKYLIPGLIDMHNHFFADAEEVPDETAVEELKVMLANGVTSSRLMNGLPFQLELRARIRKGELELPNLFVSSPQLVGSARWHQIEPNSTLVTTPEEARKAVITTLVSDVATAYFGLRELDFELDISRRTLVSREESLRLIQLRQQRGVATMLEVRQA
jgi:hypothetical protein